jgi:hypothetical protein
MREWQQQEEQRRRRRNTVAARHPRSSKLAEVLKLKVVCFCTFGVFFEGLVRQMHQMHLTA